MPVILKDQSLYAVWSSDEFIDVDCICPLCDDGNCVLNNCEYYNATIGPKVAYDSGDKFSLCWRSLEADMNNSYIYFFYEALANPPQQMPVIRKYDIVYNIVIRGELCCNSFMLTLIQTYI